MVYILYFILTIVIGAVLGFWCDMNDWDGYYHFLLGAIYGSLIAIIYFALKGIYG